MAKKAGSALSHAPVGEDQDADHRGEKGRRLPERAHRFRHRHFGGLGALVFLLPAKEPGHEQPDDHGKEDRPDRAGQPDLGSQHIGGEDNRQRVDGRTRIEKGRGRSQPRAHPVNPREERQDGAGTDRQNRPRDGPHTVGNRLRCLRTEVAHDRRLRDKSRDPARDPEGREQTEDDVLPRIPAGQFECLLQRVVKTRPTDRQEVNQAEDGQKACGDLKFVLLIHFTNLRILGQKTQEQQHPSRSHSGIASGSSRQAIKRPTQGRVSR